MDITLYHIQPSTGGVSKTTATVENEEDLDPGLDATWEECTEAEYVAQMAVIAQSYADFHAGQAAELHDKAQQVYDEIVGIHPVTALALAQQIDPSFTP